MANCRKALLSVAGLVAFAAASASAATVEKFRPLEAGGKGIPGSDGKLLAADLTLPDGVTENIPVVIFCHGFWGNLDNGFAKELTNQLVPKGIAVLSFSFDGHKGSEGEFIDMTVWTEIEDAIGVYEYLRSRPEFGKIALCGHSQGGVVASMAAGKLGTEKVSGLVIWAAAAVLKDDALNGWTLYHAFDPLNPPEYLDLGDEWHLGRNFLITAQKLPIYETAGKYKGGACVINGGSDVVVPVRYGKRFHGVLAGSTFHLLPEEDHNFGHDFKGSVAIGAEYFLRVLAAQ